MEAAEEPVTSLEEMKVEKCRKAVKKDLKKVMMKALMYNPDHITALQQLIEEMKEENLIAAHQEILTKGLKAPMREGTAFDLIKDLFFMITLTTGPKEQHYLQPLNALLFKDITTKGVSAKQFANMLANA